MRMMGESGSYSGESALWWDKCICDEAQNIVNNVPSVMLSFVIGDIDVKYGSFCVTDSDVT